MSSANPKVHEPSMEEILASIRRIISDDQDGYAPARPAIDLYAVEAEDDVRDPGPQDRQDSPPEPAAEAVILGPSDDQDTAAPIVPAEPEAAPLPEASADGPVLPRADLPLLSESVGASVAGAFGRLESHGTAAGPQTLEGTVKEMLRPMLKAWLDQNLPGIVERLVQAEIERVTRP
jgi:cell pole-organizing protein PopZ